MIFNSYFIHNDLIRIVAESYDKDMYRWKFDWDDFRIKLNDYYNTDFDGGSFIVHRYVLRDWRDLKFIEDRYVTGIKMDVHIDSDYEFNIIKNIKTLTHIIFERLRVDEIIRNNIKELKYITHVSFSGMCRGQINFLSGLKNLKYLKLGGSFNQDIDVISEFTNLEHLELEYYRFNKKIDSLKNLTNLKYLKINSSEIFGPYDMLRTLKNLRYLYLGGEVADCNFVSEMTQLRSLIFGRIENIDYKCSLEPINCCKNLQYLEIKCGISNDRVLETLKCLKNLKKLVLNRTNFRYLKSIKHFDNLKYLSFGYCYDSDDKDVMGVMKSLEHLDVSAEYMMYNNLCKLKNIKKLKIKNCEKKHIEKLKKLTHLTHLTFGYNFNESIDSLDSLTNLTHLSLGKRFNQRISVLKHLKNLKYIKVPIEYCSIIYSYVNRDVVVEYYTTIF